MIAYKYLDSHAATVAALRDNSIMRNIVDITPLEVKELYARMTNPQTGTISDMPRYHDVLARENMLAVSLDKLDVLMERYRMAIAYLNWFEPALDCLTDDERSILREFYMGSSMRSGANARLRVQLSSSRATINRHRNKAVAKLALLLFGK